MADTRRDRAIARTSDPVRDLAEKRVEAFLEAARTLTRGSSTEEFTVQEVVERSGQSLRSFYLHFDGKHELLLALFEETVQEAADYLKSLVDGVGDPLGALHLFTLEHYRLCRPRREVGSEVGSEVAGPDPVMSEFAHRLLVSRPAEATRAFAPLTALLLELLDAAGEVGAVRPGLDHRYLAGVILQITAFNAFSDTIAGFPVDPTAPDGAESLWNLLTCGLVAPNFPAVDRAP